jgi:hypothetical protein
MKKLFTILLLLLSFIGFSQTGQNYLNYKLVSTHSGNGTASTYDGVSYSGHVNDAAEFEALFDTNQPGTTLVSEGEVYANSSQGLTLPPNLPNNGDFFGVEYNGWFYAQSSGRYLFYLYSDDSSEVKVGDDIVSYSYVGAGNSSNNYITLEGDTWYPVRVRYQEYAGAQRIYVQNYSSMHQGYYNMGDPNQAYKVSNTPPEPTFVNTVSDGQNAVNYKVFSINGGDGTVGSHHPNNSSEFTTLFDYQNTAGTEWTHQGRDTATKALSWPWPNTLPRPNNGSWFGWEIDGYFVAEETGTYEFKTSSDDRSDLYMDTDLDGTLDQIVYYYEGPSRYTYEVSLTAGEEYPFRVRYENGTGGANLYITWKRPSDSDYQFNSDEIWSIKQEDIPLHYDVNYKFRNIDESVFSVNTFYEVSSSEIAQNSNSSAITLDTNGEATISSQIDENLVDNGSKATTVGGNVEWCVVYGYDNTNKRYRIGIDKREFVAGSPSPTSISKLQLFDLWDGPVTYKSDDSAWAEYYIYTDTELDFSNSTFSSNIRAMSYGNYGLQAEFSFVDINAYKTQYVVFDSPSTTQMESLVVDDYFTVGDVVLAFNELASGGINGGFKGDFDYNVQYANADVSRDGVFDFKDTHIMIDFLNGGNLFDASYLSAVMSLTELSEYESMTSTNWINYGTTRTMFPLGLTVGTKTYDKSIAVHWKGDVNMSHSHLPSSVQVTSMSGKNMRISNSSKSNENNVQIDLDIERNGEQIIVTLNVPENSKEIIGTEFRIGYDNSRVSFDKIENGSNLQPFSAKRSNYIKLGSISTDGSQNLNGGTQYKIYFKETNNLSSFLGLVSILKAELVNKDGNIIGVNVQ